MLSVVTNFFAGNIGKILVFDIVVQWPAFIVANYFKTEKFYDLTGVIFQCNIELNV